MGFFFFFLQQVERELSGEEKKQVMIEKAINLKLMCDYAVSCSYGDIVLIICMLHDYVKMLDETREDIQWKAYYRNKFITMADRLAEQIEYDYDAAVEKCRKNAEKIQKDTDVSGDALELAIKCGRDRKKENKMEESKNADIANKKEVV